MMTPDDLAGVSLWDENAHAVERAAPNASPSVRRYQSVRRILDALVHDLLANIERQIADLGIQSIEAIRSAKPRIAAFSPPMAEAAANLKSRLMERLYQHHRVLRMAAKARRVMTGLFEAYMEDPRQMPPHVVCLAGDERPMPRVIADYIAGMTDRFALEEYAKLYDPNERV
jgi:dGTPase